MPKQKKIKFLLLSLCFWGFHTAFSQSVYQVSVSKTVEECHKGSASLDLSGTTSADTVEIQWSNGQTLVTKLNDLDPGDYSVRVYIHSKLDTTLYFTIEKAECKVYISNQFTPNSDGYNDLLYIGNVGNYPNFELEIYNKWGQKVHSQKSEYTPWDGKWAGINVPDGTYYYIFFYDSSDKKKLLKGDITLLR